MKNILSVAARAFAHRNAGGNPVTVFFLPNTTGTTTKSQLGPSPALRSSLARSCAWESVMVHLPPTEEKEERLVKGHASQSKPRPTLFFYMPSGEEVSYCAHAAMGACYALTKHDPWSNNEQDRSQYHDENGHDVIDFMTAEGVQNTAVIKGKDVELGMKHDLEEMQISGDQMPKAIPLLLNQIGLDLEDTMMTEKPSNLNLKRSHGLPFVNSSVARYKTLVPVESVEKLHGASNPKDSTEFRDLCDSINSTGLYLYTNVVPDGVEGTSSLPLSTSSSSSSSTTNVYECRQFPRASGYPEDPATGIAAAALASSLQRSGNLGDNGKYVMFQGTAMGKKSCLNVRIDDDTIFCSGTVEIDSEEYVSVDDL